MSENSFSTKQVIVIRRDLGMRRGKEIAQGSHASCSPLSELLREIISTKKIPRIPDALKEWIEGSFAKVTLQVQTEEELLEVYQAAKSAGLPAYLITDSGKTEFDGVPTKTAISIGPEKSEKINKVTGHLKLY
jgi:PTH2 family peptidyl-tRNA hydrolase